MNKSGWVTDGFVGVILGGVISAIVAVNVVIYAGIEDGYEASIGDVFDESLLIGLVTVAILVGGPILGVVLMRRRRHRRDLRQSA